MEAHKVLEIIQDERGVLATGALLRHYERMERRGQEPSGEYTDIQITTANGPNTIKWPIPMPSRNDGVIEVGYN